MRKTVLITGASSGIGLEIARVFAKRGYDLVLIARRVEPMQDLAKQFSNLNIQVIQKDLTIPNACQSIFDQLEGTHIDILVNNAGFGDRGQFHTLDKAKQLSMIDLNVRALTELTHLFGSKMVKQKTGKIMNVASVVAFMPGPGMATYFATKAFVLSLSQALSQEWGKYGVQVMALCPGNTTSEFQQNSNMQGSKLVKAKNIPTSAQVAEFAYDRLIKGSTIAVHGFSNKLNAFLARVLPRKTYLKIIENIIK
ncbi:MAG: SDR family oxidoreductase [Patescibacteria group bacterium]